jgi:uncharacterized protein
MDLMLTWRGTDEWRAAAARVEGDHERCVATGVQLGVDPVPYRVDYELELAEGFVTRRFALTAVGAGWHRRLDLRHDGNGSWESTASGDGAPGLGPAGGEAKPLSGALDCDLANCPLTNFMPIRRHDLHREAGEVDFLMAWVSVPDLSVTPSRQRYEHVGRREGSNLVRYVGRDTDFVADLEVDDDGMVVFYPEMAERL